MPIGSINGKVDALELKGSGHGKHYLLSPITQKMVYVEYRIRLIDDGETLSAEVFHRGSLEWKVIATANSHPDSIDSIVEDELLPLVVDILY